MQCLPSTAQQIFFFLGPMLLCAAVLSCVAGSLVLMLLFWNARQRAKSSGEERGTRRW